MYAGQIVEHTDRISLFRNPLHPYTKGLLASVPSADPNRPRDSKLGIYGEPPSPVDPPPGCRFASRCPFVDDRCKIENPALRKIETGHRVACHLV